MMSYWGIEYVKKSKQVGVKYEAKKGGVVGFGDTPLKAVHSLVSFLKGSA